MFSLGAKVWPGISKVTEESGEVLQVCGKLIGSQGEVNHWDGTNLRVRLEEELGDVLAAISVLMQLNPELSVKNITERCAAKEALFLEWHRLGQ